MNFYPVASHPRPEHVTADELHAFFDAQQQPDIRYAGQGNARFQQALADHHACVTEGDCDFYHTIQLPGGKLHAGDWDLRQHEAAYLGQVAVSGKRVVEFGPASGWISAYLASRAELSVVDLPFGQPPEFVPHPDIDGAALRRDAARSATRLRNSWWYTRRCMGFEARAFYADIYHLPPDIGRCDVSFFGAILLHLSNPFAALQQAASLTDEAIVVTDVDSSPKLPGYDLLTEKTPGLTVFNPTEPPFGMTHWWAISPGMIAHMLRRLGFTHIEMTRHSPQLMATRPPMFTVVGRRTRMGVSAPAAIHPVTALSSSIEAADDTTTDLPVPSGRLRFSVSGTEDETTFTRLGRLGFEAIRSSLLAAGVRQADLSRVLDFGCGVGRVTRYWHTLPAVAVQGTDIAADSIAWAQANLPFAQFQVNSLAAGLPYGKGQFDLAYALSVFTHLPKAMQLTWLSELDRVTRPAGLVYVTTHGVHYRGLLSESDQAAFDRGDVVVTGDDQPGSNHCAAFHPAGWMRQAAAVLGWSVVEHLPCGARGNPEQDSWLFRTAA